MGDVPALLKAFLEQVLRPGFAMIESDQPKGLLKGKSAHVVVTMGMPGFFYATYFRAHSLKSLERNVLKMVGIKPVRHTIIGAVEASGAARGGWLDEMAIAGELAH
jgi:putative NADPH-quinone reductase